MMKEVRTRRTGRNGWTRFMAMLLTVAMIVTGLPLSGLFVQEAKAASGSNVVGTVTVVGISSRDYTSFKEMWQAAIKESENGLYPEVKLQADWLASDPWGECSFGSGTGFKKGAIYVPKNQHIILDLNGYMIDRHNLLGDLKSCGSVILVDSKAWLYVKDSNPTYSHNGYYDNTKKVWVPEYLAKDNYPFPSSYNRDRNLRIYGGVICGGSSEYGGGIASCSTKARIIINGGNIVGNRAKYGGGISNEYSHTEINGGLIGYNYATKRGGGVYTKSSEDKWWNETDNAEDLRMTGGMIAHNECNYFGDGVGGGVYADCTDHIIQKNRNTMQFNGGFICANSANEGGGIFQQQGRVELNGGFISENTARNSGGGVYANGHIHNFKQGYTTMVVLNGVTIASNIAGYGGGLYVNTRRCEMVSGKIIGNYANGSKEALPGGGVFIADKDYLQFKGGKIIIQDNFRAVSSGQTPSNISCQNFNDFSGSENEQYRLGEGSCIYVNFRKESVSDGKTFGKFLSGAPGSIQFDTDSWYVVPRDNKITSKYCQDWVIRTRTGKSEVEKLGSREYRYKDTDGSEKTATAMRGNFKYASVLDMRDMESSYYYTDALFTNAGGNGALDYDHHLATMSCVLAMSAFRRPYMGAENQAKNVKALMTDLGMKDIELTYPEPARFDFNDYTIGYAIGQKKLTEGSNAGKTLVAIAVRGANYMTEWGSNTTLQSVGTYDKQSAGFSDAADKVMQGVQRYLGRHNLNGYSDDVIFWISGYSRGGATANLTAQRLTDRFNDASNGDGRRVYAYPIEAPQGAWYDGQTGSKHWNLPAPKKANPADYKNIHNIINPDDLVPRVAPSVMGFSRFGVDHLIPGNTTKSDNRDGAEWRYRSHNDNGSNNLYKDTRAKMIEQLATLDPRIGFSDKFQISTMKFLRNTITNADLVNKNGKLVAAQDWYDGFLKNLITFGLTNNPSAGYPDTVEPTTGKRRAVPLTDPKEIAKEYRVAYTSYKRIKFDPASGVGQLIYNNNYDTRVTFQDAIEKVIVLVFGLDQAKSDEIAKGLAKCAVELDKGFKCSDGSTIKMSNLYMNDIWDWVARDTSSKNKRIKEFWELLQVAQLDKILTKQQYDDLRTVFPVLVDFAMCSVSWDWRKNSSGYLGTLLANTETLAQAHYPEVNFAWLRAQDEFFDRDGTDVYVGRKIPLDPVVEVKAAVTGVKDEDIIQPGTDDNQYITYNSQDGVLSMSTATEGAKIIYTLNGEKPRLDAYGAHVYDGPLKLYSVYNSRTSYDVRMVAYKDGVYGPESSLRFDVYPGSLKYTLTIQYGDGRTETKRVKPGESISISGAPSDDIYAFKRWNLLTMPGGSANPGDIAESDKAREKAEKECFRDVNRMNTFFTMPKSDTIISAEYTKAIKEVYIQFDEAKKVKSGDKIEWAVDNGEKRYCSPGFNPPAGSSREDYTVINAYLSCNGEQYDTKTKGRHLVLYFDPRKIDKQLPLVSGTDETGMTFKVYMNGSLAEDALNPRSEGALVTTRVQADYGAAKIELYFGEHLYDNENQKRGRLEITAKNGATKDEIVKKLPGYITLTGNNGRVSFVVKMNWNTAPLDKYDPNATEAQDFRVNATPDEKDYYTRYPKSEYPGAEGMFNWFLYSYPRADIHVLEAATLASPVVEADRETFDCLSAPKIKIRYEGSTEGVKNLRLSYTTDFGKTFIPYTADSTVDLLQYIDKDKKSFTLGVKASADNCRDSAIRYYTYKSNETLTRRVTLVNLGTRASILGDLSDTETTVNGFTQNPLRRDGYYASVKPGATIDFHGYSDFVVREDFGELRKVTYKYGNSTHQEEEELTYERRGYGQSIVTDTRTRYEDGTSRDLTITGHYDYAIEELAVDLDAEGKVAKIRARRRAESGDTELKEVDPAFYTVEYTNNKNIIDVRLRGGDGYIWYGRMKYSGDTEIESTFIPGGVTEYSVRIRLADPDKKYAVTQSSSVDDIVEKDTYSLFARRGEAVNIEAPERKGAMFAKWNVVYPKDLKIADINAPKTSYTMPGKNVKIEAEYISFKNIDEVALTIPKAVAYQDLPEGAVSADVADKVKAEWVGWQTTSAGFNSEVRAAVKLIPQKEFEFRSTSGETGVNVNTRFTVSTGDGTGEVVRADILDDGSVLAIIKQTTDKGVVNEVSWGTTEISVPESALPDPAMEEFGEELLELIPEKVTVKCTNPKTGGAAIPLEAAVNRQIQDFDPAMAETFTVTVTIEDSDKLDLSQVSKTQDYTVQLVQEPLDVKAVEWGETAVRVPFATTAENAGSYVPDEVWVTFERNGTQIYLSLPVEKECTGESGTFTVTATLDIEADAEGTKGFTNLDAVPLTQTYTLTVPDYHKVNVTYGTAEGFPGRDFDAPEWSWNTEGESGELKYVEKGDTVFINALNRDGFLFEHWDAAGITLEDADKKSPLIDFEMAEEDVTLTAVYDQEITNISAEVNEDRTQVLSVTVNDTEILPAEEYTATISGDRISVSLVPGKGRCIGDSTGLKENELLIQTLFKKEDAYSVDLMMWPVDLLVTIECVDEEGKEIPDAETVMVGLYAKNTGVTADYPNLENYEFKEWRTRNKDLTITTDDSKLVSFTMPEEKVVLEAVYEPFDRIEFVTLEIPEPKRGQKLPEAKVKATPDGGELDDEQTDLLWYYDDGTPASDAPERVPDYGEVIHALVRLEPDSTSLFIAGDTYDEDDDEYDDEYDDEADDEADHVTGDEAAPAADDGAGAGTDPEADDDEDEYTYDGDDWYLGSDVYTSFMLADGDTYREISNATLSSDGSVILDIEYRMEKRALSSVNWGNTDFNGMTVSGSNLDMGILPNMAELKFADSAAGEEPVMRPIQWPVPSETGDPVEGIVRTETDDAIVFAITGTLNLADDVGTAVGDSEENVTDGWLNPGNVALSRVYTVTLVKEPKPERPYISYVTDDQTDRITVTFVANVSSPCDIYYNYALVEGDDAPDVADPTREESLGKITYNPAAASGNSIVIEIPELYRGKDLSFRIKAITDIESTSEQGVRLSSHVADEATEIYVPGDRKLTVSMIDVNGVPCYEIVRDGGEEEKKSSVVYEDLGSGSQVLLVAPETKDEAFYRWEIPSDISAEYVQSVYYADDYEGEKEEEKLVEDSTGLSDRKGYTNHVISVKMPEQGNLDVIARYKPLISKIHVEVEEPRANAQVPDKLDKLSFVITDEYTVDEANINVEWFGTVSSGDAKPGAAGKFNEEEEDYELIVSLKPDANNKINIIKSDGSRISYDAADVRFTDDVEVTVNDGGEDTTLDFAYVSEALEEDEETFVCCVFENLNRPDDRRDGPDAATVLAECIDNVNGIYTDEKGLYEFAFDRKSVETDWKADISAHAGETMYVRYRADEDNFESKWTEIKLPEKNGSLPAAGFDYLYGRIYFEDTVKWQYRLEGEEAWRMASSDEISPDEFGWDGSRVFFSARQPGDSAHFPGDIRQVELAARPAAPEALTFTDHSGEMRGSVTGTFKYAAGSRIEVQIRYPNRSDDWLAYHESRIEEVGEDGTFLVKGLIEKKAEIRIRILTDSSLPSEWSSSFVTIAENETDELYVEKRYSVSYVMAYGGKRAATTPDYTYENGLRAFDGSKYGISANEKWFAEQSQALLKDEHARIVRYIIKGRAGNSNGEDAYIKDDKANEILIAEIDADQFKDDPNGVACSDIPIEYNEITVYAVVGSFATETDNVGGVYVNTPSPVRYTGLAHKMTADPAAQKSYANQTASFDLDLVIKDTSATDEFGDAYELVYGTDYTVVYRNNENASMKYDPATGQYTSLYADEAEAEKKSPQIIVTGKGNYKEMKTTVFFDILPLSLSADREAVGRFIDGGLADSYTLEKNGGLRLSVKPVRRGRFYDKDCGAYVNDNDKPASYAKGEILMTLQKQNENSGGWDLIGSLDGSEAAATLKKVSASGRYRVWYTGTGNFFGSGMEEQFDVYDYGTIRFSSFKLKTARVKFRKEGVGAKELVTGFKGTIKDKNGQKIVPAPEDTEVILAPLSATAVVEDNKAMSAGTYTATVSWTAEYGKYEGIFPDNPIRATVEVTGDELKASMVTLDWDKKGVTFDGKSRDITATLKGITPDDITLAKQVVSGGKKKAVPLDNEELAKAVRVSEDGKLTISGSYQVSGAADFDDTLPGTYSIAFIGKGQYGGSVVTCKVKRLPVALTSEMISAGTADFNLSGIETQFVIGSEALGISDLTEGKGDAHYAVSYSAFKADRTADGNGRIGTVRATVKVKTETAGLKKGSTARVDVDVYPASPDVFVYNEYSYDLAGKIFAQVSGDVAAGTKAPRLTLYQSSADGKKLKKIPAKYYKAEYVKEEPEPGYEAAAQSYALKLTAGKMKGFAFADDGTMLDGVYFEYQKKASRWGNIKFNDKASVIWDNGDRMIYTDRSIENCAYRTIDVDTKGRIPEVCYVGSSYILPVVDEIVVDGVTLKREDRDFIITYSKNNKAGTATMTITLTRGTSDQTMSYPLGGSKTFKFKIRNRKNKGLKL